MLPFALTLPAGWETTAVVVVLQSVVELLGMIVLVPLVPRVLFVSDRSGSYGTGSQVRHRRRASGGP